MSPNTHTRRRLGRTLPSLQPDRPQTNRTPPELWSIHRSRRDGLWGIILSFPRLFPSVRYVVHVLLSSLPRAEPSRLAWLKRNPIAVAAGRINQNVPRYKVPGWYTLLIVPDGISGADRVSPGYSGRSHYAYSCCLVCQVREVTLRSVRIGFHGHHDCPTSWMDHLIAGSAVSRSNGPVGVPADACGEDRRSGSCI